MKAYNPVDPAQLGGPGLRAFGNIAKLWNLTDQEQAQLLGLDLAVLEDSRVRARGRQAVSLSKDTLERLSCVFGIFSALHELLPSDERRAAWLRAPNKAPLFGGRSALDRMTNDGFQGLSVVSQYLWAQVHG
jgi:hypothetical protein